MQKIKQVLQSDSNRLIIFFILLTIYLGTTTYVRFDSIKLTQNPGIIFKNAQDTISNRTAGVLEFGSIIKAKSFIGDTTMIANNQWQVSPSLTLNTYRKTSPTIQGAITNIDSGTIYISPGVYNEKITLKSRVTLIGAGVNRTTILFNNDSCIVYGTGVTNVLMKDLTLSSTQTSKDTVAAIKLRRNYLDSTNSPTIVFDNLRINVTYTSGAGICTYGIRSDSSTFALQNSYVKVIPASGTDEKAVIRLKNGTVLNMFRNILICSEGNPTDAIFYLVDSRCRVTAGYNQFSITTGAVFNPGQTAGAKLYNNICNATYDGFTNVISSPNNITDADFYLE